MYMTELSPPNLDYLLQRKWEKKKSWLDYELLPAGPSVRRTVGHQLVEMFWEVVKPFCREVCPADMELEGRDWPALADPALVGVLCSLGSMPSCELSS